MKCTIFILFIIQLPFVIMFRLSTRSLLSRTIQVGSILTVSNTMMTISESQSEAKVFDYIVIGGGSGGVASARRAATYGKNVALIEGKALGLQRWY